MDQGPLVREEIEAGAEFVRAYDQVRPVKVAFWLGEGDAGRHYLYIASDEIDDSRIRDAYGDVREVARGLDLPDLDVFQIKVINSGHPLAREAAEWNERFPGRHGRRIGGQMFGGVYVDQGYIYPSPIPAAVP